MDCKVPNKRDNNSSSLKLLLEPIDKRYWRGKNEYNVQNYIFGAFINTNSSFKILTVIWCQFCKATLLKIDKI